VGVMLLRCVVTLVQIVCAGAMTDWTKLQLPLQLVVVGARTNGSSIDVLRW
jgi:hypothetical protein